MIWACIAIIVSANNLLFAQSNVPQSKWWVPNGNVFSILTDTNSNRVYIGGVFTYVGPNTRFGTQVNTITGKPDYQFPIPDSTVYAAVSDGSGGWFIGGAFSKVNGSNRSYLAHVFQNGILDTWSPIINGTVRSLFLNNNRLYIGGDFTQVNYLSHPYLASIDIFSGQVDPWNPQISNRVNTISGNGSVLYVGGDFTMVGLYQRGFIASFDLNTGGLSSWSPSADGPIRTIVVSANEIYVGGDFTFIGNQSRNYIAQLDVISALATSWNPNPNNAVNSILVLGNIVYAGGMFTYIGGSSRNYIAAINSSNGIATTWNPNADNHIYCIASDGSKIFVGGLFTMVGGQSRKNIASLNISSSTATTWNPDPISQYFGFSNSKTITSSINVISLNGSSGYIGGNFLGICGKKLPGTGNLAALDFNSGQLITSFSAYANSWVGDIVKNGTNIYIAGAFNTVNGQIRGRIAQLNATTGALGSLIFSNATAPDGFKVTLESNTRNLYYMSDAGSSFVRCYDLTGNGQPNTNGGWGNAVISTGMAMKLYNSSLYIGCQSVVNAKAIDTTTGNFTSWNPNPNYAVYSLDNSNGLVFLGGYFTSIGGQTRNRIASVYASSGALTVWNPSSGGIVTEICSNGSNVYVSGGFSIIGNRARTFIAKLSAQSDTALDWNPSLNGIAKDIKVVKNLVFTGGEFSTVGGVPQPFFAVYDTSNTISQLNCYLNTNNFCAGQNHFVSYSVTGQVNNGNVFSVQLSNSSGDFSSPITIGSSISLSGGIISFQIPINTPTGSGYKIRVVSSSPVFVGSDNGMSISISAANLYFQDQDNDGFGNINVPAYLCNSIQGYVLNNSDCNDTNYAIHPGAIEICNNNIDEDCNGQDSICNQPVQLTLRLFMEGLYIGNGEMTSPLLNSSAISDTTICDSILVEIRSSVAPFNLLNSFPTVINKSGFVYISLNQPSFGSNFYIVVRHRNCIETWSKVSIGLTGTVNYNFSQ